MLSCQSPLVPFSIGTDMFFVAKRQIQNGLLYHLKASLLSHALSTITTYIIEKLDNLVN